MRPLHSVAPKEMKEITKYKWASKFLNDIKANGITYKRLKNVVFGKQGAIFIKAVRKHGQPAFTSLKKYHELCYMANVSIQELVKKL